MRVGPPAKRGRHAVRPSTYAFCEYEWSSDDARTSAFSPSLRGERPGEPHVVGPAVGEADADGAGPPDGGCTRSTRSAVAEAEGQRAWRPPSAWPQPTFIGVGRAVDARPAQLGRREEAEVGGVDDDGLRRCRRTRRCARASPRARRSSAAGRRPRRERTASTSHQHAQSHRAQRRSTSRIARPRLVPLDERRHVAQRRGLGLERLLHFADDQPLGDLPHDAHPQLEVPVHHAARAPVAERLDARTSPSAEKYLRHSGFTLGTIVQRPRCLPIS